jgi:16S rRNA (uracil1498-N3)-methyltransferase
MRRRFLVERFENRSAVLRGDAAHHLVRVLRAETGQVYELSDGNEVWLAKAERIDRDAIEFSLIELVVVPRARISIVLLLAIVKFDRFEWALEKATELGADEIVPLAAERSEKGLILAAEKRSARWKKILLESAQQSRRIQVPTLRDVMKPRDRFAATEADARVMLSERMEARPLREILEPVGTVSRCTGPATIVLAIGPEGGWTEKEFEVARAAAFEEASLGNNVLRTETAVCSALAAVQYAFGTVTGPKSLAI